MIYFSKFLLHKTLYSYDKFEIILLRDERNVFWLKMLSEFPFLPFNYSWKNSKKRSLNIYLMIFRCQNRFLLQSFPEVTNNPRWRIIYHGSLKISFLQIRKIIFRFLATQFCKVQFYLNKSFGPIVWLLVGKISYFVKKENSSCTWTTLTFNFSALR